MDFSALLADLRDVAEKYKDQNSDPKVATIVFVDMFIKILKRTEKTSEKFEDRIVMLWVALNQLAASYKDLAPVPERHELCQYIFILCAKTVLNIEWQQLDEDDRNRQNFTSTVQSVHELLKDLGFSRFHLLLSLMKTHWTHPVLSRIMSGEEEDDSHEGLNYILGEDPEILKLRVEMMIDENCEEFALNLCRWSLRHPDLTTDLKVQQLYLFLLHKQQQFERLQEECSKIECHKGIRIINALEKKDNCQELCVRLAQTFLVQDWVRPERKCCTQDLLKLWIRLQYLADKDQEKFLDSIWAVAKVSRVTEQIGTLIDTVKKECGFTFFQLYVDLCIYAINIDKGFLEKELVEGDMEAVRKRQFAVSKTCHRLADLFMDSNFRISKISVLTAFALNPTQGAFDLVNKLFWIIKKQKKLENVGKINPATVYEVERLLNMLRPFYLNPELPWKELIPLCRKYKMEQEQNMRANISPKMTAPLSFGLSTPSMSSGVKGISQQSSIPESAMQRNICNFINLTGKKQTTGSAKNAVRAAISSEITEMPQKSQSKYTSEVSQRSNMAKRDLQVQTKEQNLCALNASVGTGTSSLDFSALKLGDVGLEMLRRHYTLQSFGETANLTDNNKGPSGHHKTTGEIRSKMEAQLLAHDISVLQLKHKSRRNESKEETDSADGSRMTMDNSKTHNSQRMNALGRSMQSLDANQISALLSLTNQTKSVNDYPVRSSSVPVNRFQNDLVSLSTADKMALGREPHEMSPDSYRQHVMELIKAATATREASSYCKNPPKKSSSSPKKKTVSWQKSVGLSPSVSPSTSHLQKSSPSFIENSNNARLKGPALTQTDPAKIASMIEASGFSNKLQPKMKAESNGKHVSEGLQDCQNKSSSLLKPVISMVVPKSVAEGAMTGTINKEALFKTISELISETVLDKDSSVPRTVVSNMPIVSKNSLQKNSELTVKTKTTVKTSVVARSGHSYTSEQLSGKTETSQPRPSGCSRSLSLPTFINSTSSPVIQQISSKERVGISIESSFIDQASGTLNRSQSMEMMEMNTALSSCGNSYGSTFGMGAQPSVGLPALSNNICVTDSQGFNLVALSHSNPMQPMSIFNATSFAGLPDLSGLMNENIDIQQLLNTQPTLLDSPVTCASLQNYLQQTSIASMPVSTQSMLQNITQVHSHGSVLGTQQIVTLSGVANVSASPQVITTFVPRHSAMQDSVQMSDQHGHIQVHTVSSPFCQQTIPDLQVVKEPIELTCQQPVIHHLSNQGMLQESVQFTGQQSTFQTSSLPLVQQTLQRQEIVQDSVRWAEQQPLIQIQNSCSPFSQQSAVVDAGNVDLPGQILTIPQGPMMQQNVNVINVQNATTPTFIQQIATPELDANLVQQILSIIEQGSGTQARVDGSSVPHTNSQHFTHQQNDDFGPTGRNTKMGMQPTVCKTSYILPKGLNQSVIDKTKMLLLKKDNFAGSGKSVSEAIEQIVSQKFAKELQKGTRPPNVNTKPATVAKSRPAKGKTNVLSGASHVQSDAVVAASAQSASMKSTSENATSSSPSALNLPVQLERPSSVPLNSSFDLQKTAYTRSANGSQACDPKLLGLLLENKVFGVQMGRTSSSSSSVPSPVLQPGAVPCANVSSSSTSVGQSYKYQASSMNTDGTSSQLLGMTGIQSSSSVGEMSQNVTSFLTAVSGILQVAPKVPVKYSSPGEQAQIPASVTVTKIPVPRAFMGSAWSTANAGVKKGDGQVSSKNTSVSTTCVSPSSRISFSPLPASSVIASQEKSSMTYSVASASPTVKESYSSSSLSHISTHNQAGAVPVPGMSCTVQTCVSPTTSVVTSMAASTSVPVTTVVQCLTNLVPATHHQGTFSANGQNAVDSPKTSAVQTSASDISCSFTSSSGSCSTDGSSGLFSSNRARSQPYSTSLIESLLIRGNTAVSTGPSESIQIKNGSELLDDRLLRKLLFQQSGSQQICEHTPDSFQPVYQQTLPSPVLSLIGADLMPSSACGTKNHLLDTCSRTKQASGEENGKDSEQFLNNVPRFNQKSCRMEEKRDLCSQGLSVFTPSLTVAAGTSDSQYSDSGSVEQMNWKHSENLHACDVTQLKAGIGEQSRTGQEALPNSESCTSISCREGSALTANSLDSRSAPSCDCDVLQQMQVAENEGISECLSQESCLVVKQTGELNLMSNITDFNTKSNSQQFAFGMENSGAQNRLKNVSDSEQKSTLNEYWSYEGGKVVMKTNSSAGQVNKCVICEQLFKSVDELRNHVVTVCKNSQKNQMSDVKDFEFKTQFSCSNCNFMSISEKIAKKHISNCKIFGTAGVENLEGQSNVARLTLVFTCKMCGKISKDKDDIHEHVSKLCTELKKFSSGREFPSQNLGWEMSELPEKEIPISGRRHSPGNSADILEEGKVGELTTKQLTSADEGGKVKDQDGTLIDTQQQDFKLAHKKVPKVRCTKVYSEKDIFKVSDWDSPRKLSSTGDRVNVYSVNDSLDGKAKMEQAVGNKFVYDKRENSVCTEQLECCEEKEMLIESKDIGPCESIIEKENKNLEDIEITSTSMKDKLKSNDNREESSVDAKALVNIGKSTYCQKEYSEHVQNYLVTTDKYEVANGKTVCENKSQKKVIMKTLSSEEIRKQRLKGLRDKRLIKRRKFLDEEMDDPHKEAVSKRLARRAKVRQPVSATKEKRHECTSCAGRFYLRTELIKHIGFKHLQAFRFIRPDRFICRYCKTMFPTCIGVLNHMIQHTQTILESVNRKQHAADQRSRLAAKLNEIRKTSSRSTQSRLAAQKVTRKSRRFTTSSRRNRPIITVSTQESSGKDIKGQKSSVKKPSSKVTRDKAFTEGIYLEAQNVTQAKRFADKVADVKEERIERRGRPRKCSSDPKKEMKKTDDKIVQIERRRRLRCPIPETSPGCPIPETSPGCPIPETSPRCPIPETSPGCPIPEASPRCSIPETKEKKMKMFKNGEIRVERRGRPRKYPINPNKEVNGPERNPVTGLDDSVPVASSKDAGRETRSRKKYQDVGVHNSDSDIRLKKESGETEEERNRTSIHQTPQKDQYCKQDDDDQKHVDSVKEDIMPTRRSVRLSQSTKEQAEIRTDLKEMDEVKNIVQKVDNRVETRQLRTSVDKMPISDDKFASDSESKISRTPKKEEKLDLKADNNLGSSKRMSTRSKVKHKAAIGSDSEDNISLYSNSESTQGHQRTIDSLRIRRVSTRLSKLDAESKVVGNDNLLKAENARNSHNKHKLTSVEIDQTKSLPDIKSSSRNSMPLHSNSADNILSETDKKDVLDRSPSRRRSAVSRDSVFNSSDGSEDKISKEKNPILKERQSSRESTVEKSRKRKRSFSSGSDSSLLRHIGQKPSDNDASSKDTMSETERITRSKIIQSSLIKVETSKGEVESQAQERRTRSKKLVSGNRALDNEKKKEIETPRRSFSTDSMNSNIKEKSKRSARSVSPIVEKETLKTESVRKTVQDTKKKSNDKSPNIEKESETKLKMDLKSSSSNKSVQIVSPNNCDKQGKTSKIKRSGSSYTFKRKLSLRKEDKGRSRKVATRIVKKKAAVNSCLVKSRSSLRKAKLNLAKSQRLKTAGQNSSVCNSTKKSEKMEQLCKSGYVKLSLQRLSVLLPADDEEFAAVKSPPTTVLKVKEKSPVACKSEKDTSKTVTIKEDKCENLHQGKRKGNDFINNQKDPPKKIKMQKSHEGKTDSKCNSTIEVDEEQGTKKVNTVENSETDGHKDTESSIVNPPSFETAFRQFASGNSGIIVNRKEMKVIQKDSLHSKLPTSRNFLSAFEEFASSPITYSRRRNYMNSQMSIAESQHIPMDHLNGDSSRNLNEPDESLADHGMKSLSKDAKDDEMSPSKDSTGTQTEEVATVDKPSEAQTEGVSKGDRYQLPDLDKNVSNIQYPDIEKSKGSYMSSFLTYVANYTNDGTGVDSENSCDGKYSEKVSLQSERLKNFREQHNSVGFTWDMSDGDVQCPKNSSTSKKRTSREQNDSKTQTKSNASKNCSVDEVRGNVEEASSSTSVKETVDLIDKPCSADLAMEKKAPGKSDRSPSSVHKETSTKYYMPRKPVRHIYHGGKVWEIQKGSIKSTVVVQNDRQVTATDLSKKPSGALTVQEDKLRLRSSSLSQEEAHEGTAQDWSREKSVQAGDLNNYICKTLNEIRKQRNQQRNTSTSKWQVQKKKPDVKKFPYSFTRSRKIH